MTQDIKWRFPAANYGKRKGISSGDTEAFKKAPYSAFAREILQNSIDANDSDEEAVRVEFKLFKVKTNDIPGINDLRLAVKRCKDFWEYKQEYIDEYTKIENELLKEELVCLRVSDYNTTGLIGVESTENEKNQFLALTRGTGVSEKGNSVAGGSKGMGKNAAFLMSKVRIVFYSTKTTKNINGVAGEYLGGLGVADFISGYIDDVESPNRDYTQGEGYYSVDSHNSALNALINIDSNDYLRNTKAGTDIYIISFRDDKIWEKEIINSILDSFMAAIIRKKLEVVVNDIEINNDTVKDIVYGDIILKGNKSNIISQYRLLTDGENVKVYDIETELGPCELYILPLSKEEETIATHKCVMIRHPYMKIKDESLGASFRASAMCIIENNLLGQSLRNIENPQHIDWEPKRIQDDPALKKEYENILKQIKTQINEKVIECLALGDTNPLDPYGAGDFLPDEDFGDSKAESKGDKNTDEIKVSPEKKVKGLVKNPNEHYEDEGGLQPDIGGIDGGEDGQVEFPTGENKGSGGEPRGGENTGGKTPGDTVILTRSKLVGVRYKIISTDKRNGKIKIIFISPISFKGCYLNVCMLDDTGNQQNVEILEMKKNNNVVLGTNPFEYGPFEIIQNEKVVLEVTTNTSGFFGASVKVVCIEGGSK